METTPIDKQGGPQEGLCPRCGADAEWGFANLEKTSIEVICPECGRYEVPKAEFDVAQNDIAEPDEV